MSDDVFDNVKAPIWSADLDSDNRASEELEESFFPEPPEIEEVIEHIEQIEIKENPEDLSRLAMFGNKPPVKRRSQTRREQEDATINRNAAGNVPSRPPSRPTSRGQSFDRKAGPQTRSMTRASSVSRRTPVIPPPTQPIRVIPAPTQPIRMIPAPTHAIRQSRGMDRTATAVRGPLPRPIIAFGCVVRQKPVEPRASVIRPRAGISTPNKALPLRAYPSPSGMTPARPLTMPVTPSLAMPGRSNERLQNVPRVQRQPISRPGSARNANTGVQNRQHTQQATPRRTIPNTYTHGLSSSSKVRRRHPSEH